jgi:hypothetical protein
MIKMAHWLLLHNFYSGVTTTFPLAKFSEYKVMRSKREGSNHIVKATERHYVKRGPVCCLLGTLYLSGGLVVLKCSAFICNWIIFSYRPMFESNLLPHILSYLCLVQALCMECTQLKRGAVSSCAKYNSDFDLYVHRLERTQGHL